MSSSSAPALHWVKIAGMALLTPAAFTAFLIALNRFDEVITPATQAWLDYPVPAAPKGANGYLDLLALDAQAAQPIEAAAASIRAEYLILATTSGARQRLLLLGGQGAAVRLSFSSHIVRIA